MINFVNLAAFRITMETHLWVCLWRYFQKGLAEEEAPSLNVYMYAANPAGIQLYFLSMDTVTSFSLPYSHNHPNMGTRTLNL